MNEYAVLGKSGSIINVVMYSGVVDESVRKRWVESFSGAHKIVPLSNVSQFAKDNYRYWSERP